MKKRLAGRACAGLLACVMMLSLAGCGDSASDAADIAADGGSMPIGLAGAPAALSMPEIHTITFDPNGGIMTGSTSRTTGADGKLSGGLPVATRAGYELTGWYYGPSGAGTPASGETVFGNNTTLYAGWRKSAHTVTFDPNGGSYAGARPMVATSVKSDPAKTYADMLSSADLAGVPQPDTAPPKADPADPAWVFDGWYTSAGGGVKIEAYGTGSGTRFSGDTTVYAHWRKGLSYDTDGAVDPAARNGSGWAYDEGTKTLRVFSPAGSSGAMTAEREWMAVKDMAEHLIVEDLTDIGPRAFDGFTALKDARLASSIRRIDAGAFRNCRSLVSIVSAAGDVSLPPVTEIGDEAFLGCESLVSIGIPEGCTRIGESAFRNCRALTKVVLPASAATVGEMAFMDCGRLTELSIGSPGTSFAGSDVFTDCVRISKITIPGNLANTRADLFTTCNEVAELLITHQAGDVCGDETSRAFYRRDTLRFLTFDCDGSSGRIRDDAFDHLPVLERLDVKGGIQSVGARAFYDCDALRSALMAGPVKLVDAEAFRSCDILEHMTLAATTETIGNYAFAGDVKLYGDSEIKPVRLNNGSWVSGNLDGVRDSYIHWLEIPAATTSIGEGAFQGCAGVTDVVIRKGSAADRTIGKYAFQNCSGMVGFTFEEGNSHTTRWKIGESAFGSCSSLVGTRAFSGGKLMLEYFEDGGTLGVVLRGEDGEPLLDSAGRPQSVSGTPYSARAYQAKFQYRYEYYYGWYYGWDWVYKPSYGTSVTNWYDGLLMPLDVEIGKYAFSGCSSLQHVFLRNGRYTIASEGIGKTPDYYDYISINTSWPSGY